MRRNVRRCMPALLALLVLCGCAGSHGGRPDRSDSAATGAAAGAALGIATQQPLMVPLFAVGGGIVGWLVGEDAPLPPQCVTVMEQETFAMVEHGVVSEGSGPQRKLVRCVVEHDAGTEPVIAGVLNQRTEPGKESGYTYEELRDMYHAKQISGDAAYRKARCGHESRQHQKNGTGWCAPG